MDNNTNNVEKNNVKKDVVEKKESQPLWMPQGSIRAIITLVVVAVMLYCCVIGVSVDEKLWMLVTTVMAFYFGMRSEFKLQK